jgi:hypothetical protein
VSSYSAAVIAAWPLASTADFAAGDTVTTATSLIALLVGALVGGGNFLAVAFCAPADSYSAAVMAAWSLSSTNDFVADVAMITATSLFAPPVGALAGGGSLFAPPVGAVGLAAWPLASTADFVADVAMITATSLFAPPVRALAGGGLLLAPRVVGFTGVGSLFAPPVGALAGGGNCLASALFSSSGSNSSGGIVTFSLPITSVGDGSAGHRHRYDDVLYDYGHFALLSSHQCYRRRRTLFDRVQFCPSGQLFGFRQFEIAFFRARRILCR